ncbi:hypothetical protein QBC40DRAFT_80387 [Triangularia verruculosa]|uniref:SET domain-containing protein n=1 Tax=Triangularia verruculosa TaxID=2587418 RepID=A0AAN7AU86_9PEZI|nr:hypothetical protein QBC40DRAFT_80387 [Triangularia verruculosa]
MGSVAAKKGVFDASKSASVPKNAYYSPPKHEPAVYIDLVSPDVGYGVFAARDFEQGEFIFHEAPLIEPADFCEARAVNDSSHAERQFTGLSMKLGHTHSLEYMKMRFAFPRLAAQLGRTLPTYDEVLLYHLHAGLGTNLVHGKFRSGPGCMLLREEYDKHIKHVQTEVVARGGGPKASIPDKTIAAADFYRDYAFQDKGVGRLGDPATADPRATRKATIYLLASLINHCCKPGRKQQKRTGGVAGPLKANDNNAGNDNGGDDGAQDHDAAKKGAGKNNADKDDNNTGDSNDGNNNGGGNNDTGNASAGSEEAGPGSQAGPSGVGSSSTLKAIAQPKVDVDAITFVVDDNATAQGKNSDDGASSHVSSNEAVASGGEEEEDVPGAPPHQNGRPRPGPNCEWRIGPGGLAKFVQPHHIAVQAKRPIRAGEELTWDYGKEDQGFTCLCATCNQGPQRPCVFL